MTEAYATATMPDPSPRAIGVVWLLYFMTVAIGAFLSQGSLNPANAADASARILDHQSLYRDGVFVTVFANALYVVLTALLYGLFAPVNRSLSLAGAFLSLSGCIVQIVAAMLQLAPIAFARDSTLAASFTAEQLRAASLTSLKLYAQTFQVSFTLFALFNIILSYLIWRSEYVPRIFGVFFLVAGLSWMGSFWPPLATVTRYTLLPASGLAEVGLTLWLVVKGVDAAKWRGQVIRGIDAGAPST